MTSDEIYKTEEYQALMRKYESAQAGLEEMDQKLQQVQQMNNMLNAGGKQWEQQKIMQEQIIQHQIGNSDGAVKKLEDEIIELRAELKLLKNKEKKD